MRQLRIPGMLIAACLLMMVTNHAHAQTHMLMNSSFEYHADDGGPSYWTVKSPGTEPLQYSGEHHSGAVSAMLVGDGKARQWRQRVTETFDITEFRLSAWVKADNMVYGSREHASLYGHILYKDQPYSEATHFYVRLDPGTYDWRQVTVTAKANPDYEIAYILVSVTGKFSKGTVLFDDVSLSEAIDVTPRALMARKIDDLASHLREIEQPDTTVAEAIEWLTKATASLDDLSVAHAHWVTAAKQISHPMWAVMYPEAMTDRTAEARMIYHGVQPTKAGCDTYLDKIELTGCNGVLLSLGSWVSVIYHSDILPVAEAWKDFDALKYFIEEAHKRDIRVYGYLANFTGVANPKAIPGNIPHDHPEWMVKRGQNPNMPLFPDPAKPQVLEHQAQAYVELVTRYDLDGVGLDYIRYPTDTSFSFDEYNRQRVLKKYGVDILDGDVTKDGERWNKVRQYRIDVIDHAIGVIHDAVRKADPDTQIIASLISDLGHASQSFGQNWAESARYLDYASPMNYGHVSMLENMLVVQRDAFKRHDTAYIPAIGGMGNVHRTWTISDWAKRVAIQRRIGCDGIIIYRIGEFDNAVAAFFGKGPFYGNVTFPDGPID